MRHLLYVLLIVSLGTSIYANTFSSPFTFDDTSKIVENRAIRNMFHLKPIWERHSLRFFTYLSFALNYRLGKLHVFGYHLFNLLIHLLSSVFVYFLILHTFKTPRMKNGSLERRGGAVAIFSSLIFLTHPLQTQAVTYIVQRATSLATCFYLGAMLLYVQTRLKGTLVWVLATLFVTVSSMFTKPIAITLPFAFLLYELIFFGIQKKELRRRLLVLLPFFLTLAIIPYLVSRYGAADFSGAEDITRQSKRIPRTEYFLTQLNVIRTYLRLLFFPVNQNLDYDYPLAHSLLDPPTLFSASLLAALFFSAVKWIRKQRLAAFGVFLFFLGLAPESSIYPISDLLYEHRLYLPMTGFAIFLSTSSCLLLKDTKRWMVAALGIVLLFSWATVRRNAVWKDEVSLWEDVVKKSPKKARPYNNLGASYGKKGDFQKEIAYLHKALDLNPRYFIPAQNLGNAYLRQGRFDKAILYSEMAIRLNPKDARAYNTLGTAYAHFRNYDKATKYCQKAVRLDPENAKAYNNLGVSYGRKGDHEREMKYLLKAIQQDPEYAEAYNNLGTVYGRVGNPEQAITYFQKAVAQDPFYADAYYNLGVAFHAKGDHGAALEEVARLKKMDRNDLALELGQVIGGTSEK